MDEPFVKLYKRLMFPEKITNKQTGEVFMLDTLDKLLYTYMYDRWCFFHGENKLYYDTQEALGYMIGVSSRTVMKRVKTLSDVGLLKIKKRRISAGMESNVYYVQNIFDTGLFSFEKSAIVHSTTESAEKFWEEKEKECL